MLLWVFLLFLYRQPCSVLAARATGGGRIGGIGHARLVGVLVEDHQGADYARNPPGAGENRYNQERTTTLVHYSQRRENNR